MQTSRTSDNKITISGTQYALGMGVNSINDAKFTNSDESANYYIDQYGYVVETTSTASTDYVYIVASEAKVNKSFGEPDPTVEVRAVLADGTVGVYDLAMEKRDGNWYIKGLDTVMNVSSDNDALQATVDTALNADVFGYRLNNGVLTLEAITSGSNSMNSGDVYRNGVAGNAIKRGVSSVRNASNTLDILLNNETIYVLYNATDKDATVYTGNANLPGTFTSNTVRAVFTANDADVGTATVVFATANVTTSSTSEYVYIDADKYTTEWRDGEDVIVYQGIAADGSTVAVTNKTPLTKDGIYGYNEDMTVITTARVNEDSSPNDFDDSYYARATGMELINNLLKVGTVYYNVTADTQIIYVDDDLSAIDNSEGFVVLAEKDNAPSTDVAVVYVTK